jgi:Transposase zinc-ribbon domain
MHQFSIGDRIRLSKLGESRNPRKRVKVGTVVSQKPYKPGPASVLVLFDGQTVPLRLHHSYIERIADSTEPRGSAAPKAVNQMTIAQFDKAFPDEEACRAYLVARRWPNGVKCPRCGATASELRGNPFHWQCYDCAPATSDPFSHVAGTIFENTDKPLRYWYRVIHTMLTSKKGASTLEIKRTMGFGSYKTAWYMCHRIRVALVESNMDKLGGIVEVDERSFRGGKAKIRYHDRHGGKPRPTAPG